MNDVNIPDQQKNDELIVYLDMDGVLVDFDKGFENRSKGIDLKTFAQKYGEEAARAQYLRAGLNFWAGMSWIQGGKEIWEASSNLFATVCILSSAGTTDPQMAEVVRKGKLQWLKNNIPSIPSNNIFIVNGKHLKQQYAKRDSVLVDDVAQTIKQWNAAGGFGILHNHKNYKKTIEELEDLARPIKISELIRRIKR